LSRIGQTYQIERADYPFNASDADREFTNWRWPVNEDKERAVRKLFERRLRDLMKQHDFEEFRRCCRR
jgi:hypothetical protein